MILFLLLGVTLAVDTTCDPGSYLANGITCTICTNGFYCPGGASTYMLKCAPGTYSDFEQSECTLCPAGFKCSDPSNVPNPCPQGSYSAAGSTDCIACSTSVTPGAVCTKNGLLRVCQPGDLCDQSTDIDRKCPATKYCSPPNFQPLDCPVGTYAAQGSSSCTICPQGYFCPASSTKTLAISP
jgi:hypothetical protein